MFRFCPHLLVHPNGGEDSATPDDIVEAVLRLDKYKYSSPKYTVNIRAAEPEPLF